MSPFFSTLIQSWNATLLGVALVTNTIQVRLFFTGQQHQAPGHNQAISGNPKLSVSGNLGRVT
jgi:hypothetical protein